MTSTDQSLARVVVDVRSPVVDGGRYEAKTTVGELVVVEADVFGDGHDHVDASVWVCPPGGQPVEIAMQPLGNDRWRASFTPDAVGLWRFRVEGWIDRFDTWRSDTRAKEAAGLDIRVELAMGAALLPSVPPDRALHDDTVSARARRELDRVPVGRSPDLPLRVEVERARFSAWYELFPRSTVDGDERHGTLRDVIDRLPYVADLGFDVLYLPPIHPIGHSHRKGPNNTLGAAAADVGSPWAIGAEAGGHTAVHPALGTIDDVRRLARAARDRGLSLALDIAFQASPDHPWVREHPQWFRHRPDGTIQYAENPPKKYQDIYPFDFESKDWRALWQALADVVRFWIDAGVTVFRVDNPHTKPFAFWEWLIAETRARHPETIFLSEAFTRPRVMEQLAKVGFSQSYTYFTWRQAKWELEEYFRDLSTRTVDYLRPNAWPNTPDILTEQLQQGGRAAFAVRAVLAATLAASWGVYGPAFELVEQVPVRSGSEEYLDSEKYQLRRWDLADSRTLAPLLRRLNQLRRQHSALQQLRGLHFHRTDNDAVMCYSKRSTDGDAMLMVVNLDPHGAQSAWVDVDLAALGLPYESTYVVRDELNGGAWAWHGAANWVHLDPTGSAAHVLSVEAL